MAIAQQNFDDLNVDIAARANDRILVYKTGTNTHVYEAKPTGGGGPALERFVATKTDGQNVNTTSDITWDSAIFADAIYTHSGGSSGIALTQSGWYQYVANVGFSGSAVRGNIVLMARLNSTVLPGAGKSGYIRNSSGHNEASCHVSGAFQATANDVFRIQTAPEAGNGTLTADSGQSNILLMKIG